jgi:hypothetical protein
VSRAAIASTVNAEHLFFSTDQTRIASLTVGLVDEVLTGDQPYHESYLLEVFSVVEKRWIFTSAAKTGKMQGCGKCQMVIYRYAGLTFLWTRFKLNCPLPETPRKRGRLCRFLTISANAICLFAEITLDGH